MKHEREGRTGARASAPTFPPADEATSPPISRADSSHVARRRIPSAPSHEVKLDDLELCEDLAATLPVARPVPAAVLAFTLPPAQSSRPPARVVPPPPPRPSPAPLRGPLGSPPSPPRARPAAAPFEVPLAPETLRVPFAPPRPLSVSPAAETPRWRISARTLIGLALFAISAGAVAGLAVRARDGHHRAARSFAPAPVAPPPVVAPTAAPEEAAPPAAAEVPVVDVANLPRPHDGVVAGSPGHRLWIDGALAPSWKVTLPCGAHVIQVGSAGVPRTVDVPCGSTVMVSP